MTKRHSFVLLAATVVASFVGPTVPQLAGDERASGHLYCSTASPLGVVYADLATCRWKRLFRDPVYELSRNGPQSWVAALRNGESIEIFKDGAVIRRLKLQSISNYLLGWTPEALVYRTKRGVYALDVSQGGTRQLSGFEDAIAVHPTTNGWVELANRNSRLEVRLYLTRDGKPLYTWHTDLPGKVWDSSVVGGRYLVVWTAKYNVDGVRSGDNLRIFDLVERRVRALPTMKRCNGFCEGRSRDELLVALGVMSKSGQFTHVKVEAVHLPDMSKCELAMVGVPDADLVGLSADEGWLIMYMVYADGGPGKPGKVIALRVKDGHRKAVRDDVYECVLTP